MDFYIYVVFMIVGGNDLDFIIVVENCFIERVWLVVKCGGFVDVLCKKIDVMMMKMMMLLLYI